MTEQAAPTVIRVSPGKRLEVAEFLRKVSVQLGRGDIDASAVVLVLTEADVHRPYFTGYPSHEAIHRALMAAKELVREHSFSGEYDAEALAERMRRYARDRSLARERVRLEKPFECVCGFSYRTERGLKNHAAKMRSAERSEDDWKMLSFDSDGSTGHYSRLYARMINWDMAGWYSPIHYLKTVHRPEDVVRLRALGLVEG